MKKTLCLLVIIFISLSLASCNNDKTINFGEYHNLSSDDKMDILFLIKSGYPPEILRNLTQDEFQKVYDYLLTLEIIKSRTNKKKNSMTTKPSNYTISLDIEGKRAEHFTIGDDFIFIDKSHETIDMVVHTVNEGSIDELEVLLNELFD